MSSFAIPRLATPVSSVLKTPRFGDMTPRLRLSRRKVLRVKIRGSSENRMPLQKGRNLSIEAIQTVQALKRAKRDGDLLDRVFDSKFRRLLKLDTMAVLRELLRQNECLLVLKVYDEVRKEYWYKPQVSLYADIIAVLASSGLFEHVENLHSYLMAERSVEPDSEGFSTLLRTYLNFGLINLAMESFYLMRKLDCEPDKACFRMLIGSLESAGEKGHLAVVRQHASEIYGESLGEMEEATSGCGTDMKT